MKKKFSKILGIGLTLSLLTSLLLTAAPVSALNQPDVTLSHATLTEDTISREDVEYSIIFTLGADLPETGKIVIEFPTGTDLSDVTNTDILLSATSGIGSDAFMDEGVTTIDVTDETLTITIPNITPALDLSDLIGVGALVQVVVADVTNPDDAGDYTLDVSTLTSGDVTIESAVTSTTYTLVIPTVSPLPGIVVVKNASGIPMENFTGYQAISLAIAAADEDYTIVIDAMGNVTEPVVFQNFLFANMKSRLRAQGDPIRGDLPIVPCEGNWFSVHPNVNLDLQEGALNVMGGATNETNRALAQLVFQASGNADTTIGGVNLADVNMTPQYTGQYMDIQNAVQISGMP